MKKYRQILLGKVAVLKSSANLKEIITGTVAFFGTKILGIILSFAFTLFVTNKFGAQGWGRYAICFSILNIFAIFCMLGFENVLIKYVSIYHGNQDWAKLKGFYFKCLSIILPTLIILSLLLVLCSKWFCNVFLDGEGMSPWIQVVGITLPAYVLFNFNNAIISGMKQIFLYGIFKNIALFGLSLLLFFIINPMIASTSLARFSSSGIVLLLCYAFAVYISLTINKLIVVMKSGLFSVTAIPDLSRKQLLKQAMPMFFIGYMVLALTTADLLMLGAMKSDAEVGLYDIAVKISILLGIAVVAVNSIVSPKISQYFHAKNHSLLNQTVKFAVKLNFWLTLPLAIFILIFADFMLSFFGTEFLAAKWALLILLGGQMVIMLTGSARSLLVMTGNEVALQKIMLAAVVMNIVLNFILIPLYSYNGAAIASSVSIGFLNLASVYVAKKETNILSFYIPGVIK